MISGSRSSGDGDHSRPLLELGVAPAAVAPLEKYLGLLAAWNQRTNLTAAGTAEERVRILVRDPWRAAGLLRQGSLIDIGSGNGSPGLVLALLRPDLGVTLLEPRARRWAFLREVVRVLGREDVTVVRGRCEEFQGEADTVTMRAVALDLRIVSRLMAPGGDLFVFGGRPAVVSELRQLETRQLEETELHHFQKIAS